jgi:N-acetylmuramic acid 6-phosphate etherase
VLTNTESLDARFADIDIWPLESAVEAMLEGQMAALTSLKSQTGAIALAATTAAERLTRGGRLAYAGAGTSGRVAAQDGVELGPTFGWPPERMVYFIAGGMAALSQSVEGAEDDAATARAAVIAAGLGPDDVLIGVAASGRTPFTVAALDAARAAGALTISLANNAATPLLLAADHPILAETGSEVIAGSTRMQAGTAQKAVLNMLATAIMLRLGRVYRGQMVDMIISNAKLQKRAQIMVRDLAACSEAVAITSLEAAQNNIRLAILIALGRTRANAEALLAAQNGDLRAALNQEKSCPD